MGTQTKPKYPEWAELGKDKKVHINTDAAWQEWFERLEDARCKVVEDHGGHIEVECGDQEKTFHCILPVASSVSESLSNLAIRSQLLVDPRELILEEGGEDLGI